MTSTTSGPDMNDDVTEEDPPIMPRDMTNYPRAADYGLWALQCLLAGTFLVLGMTKLLLPLTELAAIFGWPGDFPPSFARVIGVLEVLGAAGLILPAATRIYPIFTAIAASCLATLMLMATMMHVLRYDFALAPFTLLLTVSAGFVAWARYARVPISRRHFHEVAVS